MAAHRRRPTRMRRPPSARMRLWGGCRSRVDDETSMRCAARSRRLPTTVAHLGGRPAGIGRPVRPMPWPTRDVVRSETLPDRAVSGPRPWLRHVTTRRVSTPRGRADSAPDLVKNRVTTPGPFTTMRSRSADLFATVHTLGCARSSGSRAPRRPAPVIAAERPCYHDRGVLASSPGSGRGSSRGRATRPSRVPMVWPYDDPKPPHGPSSGASIPGSVRRGCGPSGRARVGRRGGSRARRVSTACEAIVPAADLACVPHAVSSTARERAR